MALVSHFPIYDGPNYSPVAPLLKLHRVGQPKQDDLCSQIQAKYEDLNSRDEGLFQALAERAYITSCYIQGHQIWQRNYYNGGKWDLVPSPKRNPSENRGINAMQFQVSQMIEDIVSSNPDFEPSDMFKTYAYEKKVKASKAVWNHYERKFYDGKDGAWFNLQQANSLITSGMAIEELIYDASIKGIQVLKDIWGNAPVEISQGSGRCFSCGFEGSHDDFHQWDDLSREKEDREVMDAAGRGDEEARGLMRQSPLMTIPQCSKCGSMEAHVEQPQSMDVPTITGQESYQLGDFRLNNMEVQSVKYNPANLPEYSSWMIDKQYFPLGKMKHLFGRDIEIGTASENDVCLDYLHKMARIGASSGGARMEAGNAPGQADSALLIRMSLSAEELADIDIPSSGDLITASGAELPSGGTLADVCPEGATILSFNNFGEATYGIYPRHHSTRISSAVYFSKANSGTGRGAEDLAEVQKRKNRLDAQQVAAVDGASPGYAVVEGAMAEKHQKRIGFPNARVPVKRALWLQSGKNIDNLVKQFNPQAVAPQLFDYKNDLDKYMQMTAHNATGSNTVYDAPNRTATSAKILEQLGKEITLPFLTAKAGMRQGTRKNLLAGYRENFAGVKRNFALGGDQHVSKIEVTPEMVDPEVEFEVVENSIISQNYYARQGSYGQFLNAVAMAAPQGGLAELKQTDPALLSTLAKAFNVDVDGGEDYDQITEINRRRMEDAFQLAEIFEGMMSAVPAAPPQMAAQMPQQPQMMPSQPPPADAMQVQPEQPNALTAQPEMADNAAQPMPSEEDLFEQLIFSNLELPIMPDEKDLSEKSKWFQDYLDTQEALELPAGQRKLCFAFIRVYREAARSVLMAEKAQVMMDDAAATLPTTALTQKVGQMMGMGEEEEETAKPSAKKAKTKSKTKTK